MQLDILGLSAGGEVLHTWTNPEPKAFTYNDGLLAAHFELPAVLRRGGTIAEVGLSYRGRIVSRQPCRPTEAPPGERIVLVWDVSLR